MAITFFEQVNSFSIDKYRVYLTINILWMEVKNLDWIQKLKTFLQSIRCSARKFVLQIHGREK